MAFLNGKMLGQGGNLGSPYARNHAKPMMFSIPEKLFVEGPNQFDLYVVSEAVGNAARKSGWSSVWQARRKRAVSVQALVRWRQKQIG